MASGAVDIALAIGVEKLKDTGYGGLPTPFKGTFNDLWMPMGSAPAGFAQLAAGYRTKHGISKQDLKQGIAHVSWKSHQNGVKSPKAHLRKAVVDGNHPGRANDRRAARAIRLLRRIRWCGLRHRHHARNRARPWASGIW